MPTDDRRDAVFNLSVLFRQKVLRPFVRSFVQAGAKTHSLTGRRSVHQRDGLLRRCIWGKNLAPISKDYLRLAGARVSCSRPTQLPNIPNQRRSQSRHHSTRFAAGYAICKTVGGREGPNQGRGWGRSETRLLYSLLSLTSPLNQTWRGWRMPG